jgi:hypothetical protein
VEEIQRAWSEPQPAWAKSRLLVVRLIAQHENTVIEIMKIAGVCPANGLYLPRHRGG